MKLLAFMLQLEKQLIPQRFFALLKLVELESSRTARFLMGWEEACCLYLVERIILSNHSFLLDPCIYHESFEDPLGLP